VFDVAGAWAGDNVPPLLQCLYCMADWKQITARIRRARTGKDPATQLSNLYQKTRDAMVAFELAKFFETAGQSSEAAKWYSTAAERFRRSDWKTKAQEAAVRLSGQPSGEPSTSDDLQDAVPAIAAPDPVAPFEQTAAAFESIVAAPEDAPAVSDAAEEAPQRGVRRRGRRGGRNRRKTRGTPETPLQSPAVPIETLAPQPPPVDVPPEPRFSRVTESLSAPQLPLDVAPETGASARGRYGDPGLSSRLSLLEMQFRRLLTCTPMRLSEADRAPAGPGVLLLSDSDLSTYYYVEPCQTLRIAIGSFLRGTGNRRGVEPIKPRLADHLGIAETRVTKYLADHCVVRYLQLDEGASHFAHFVTAVLRPTLNE
jgi:hypothetical protein